MGDFAPKTEQEIKEEMVWPKGIYDFEITKAERKQSKNGNAMLVVDVKLYNEQGQERTIRDWLVASDAPLALMKLRHYCRALGGLEAYEAGDLDAFPGVGSAGRCEVSISDSDEYGPQNRVKDYLPPKSDQSSPGGVPGNQTRRANELAPADDIPF